MAVHAAVETSRLRELGAFLRDRRGRVSPADVGLPPGMRRRTPGLRREEVAQLAGVGVTWYTWLEQGRDIRVSDLVLSAVARALCLEPMDRVHLFRLAGREAQAPIDADLGPAHLRVLERWEPFPAYLKGGLTWDVLAWNRPMAAVIGDYLRLPDGRCNVLWATFLRAESRDLYRDWEQDAARMVASFRLEAAPRLDDPAFAALVQELREQSPEFAAMWDRRDVHGPAECPRRLCHPTFGELEMDVTQYDVVGQGGLKLVLYSPAPDSRTEEVLRSLELPAIGPSPVVTIPGPYKRSPDALP
jgi:hypothetical protein